MYKTKPRPIHQILDEGFKEPSRPVISDEIDEDLKEDIRHDYAHERHVYSAITSTAHQANGKLSSAEAFLFQTIFEFLSSGAPLPAAYAEYLIYATKKGWIELHGKPKPKRRPKAPNDEMRICNKLSETLKEIGIHENVDAAFWAAGKRLNKSASSISQIYYSDFYQDFARDGIFFLIRQ
jgi:hypothetical protein